MKRYFLKAIGLAACIGMVSTHSLAQDRTIAPGGNNDEIIIRKKGDKDTKVTVEIHGDDVIVNGKPLSDFEDENITVRKRRPADGLEKTIAPVAPRSPFRGGTMNLNNNEAYRLYGNANRALLGVASAKDDNGVKVTSITKGSAAEKAGLKEGDVITRVDDTNIQNPEDLTKAIGKYKPNDNVAITYKRGKQELKTTATLAKRPGVVNLPNMPNLPDMSNFERDFNFNFDNHGENGYNLIMRSNNPRIGIKAQDTEDGKGVKVLDIDDGSNAQKAGIKQDDVVTEFDGKAVNSAADLAEAARDAKDKISVKVKLTRNGKSQQVEIKIPRKLKTATL